MMNKHNLLIKTIKKKISSINSLLETYFNKLNSLKSSFKNGELIRNNKVFLVIITVMEIIIQSPGFYVHLQDAVLFVQFCIDGIIHIASQIKI